MTRKHDFSDKDAPIPDMKMSGISHGYNTVLPNFGLLLNFMDTTRCSCYWLWLQSTEATEAPGHARWKKNMEKVSCCLLPKQQSLSRWIGKCLPSVPCRFI